jgi:DNA adenine methylase
MRDASPLRYPGGKWRIASFIERFLKLNNLRLPAYIEPYAGGASLALSLLFRGRVSEIYLNDLDPAVFAFWYSVLRQNQDFVDLITHTPVTVEEWKKQKAIYNSGAVADTLSLGFATFFLNRTNHSGILNAGMIGGKDQSGEWKIDARYNQVELQRRIERIGRVEDRIHVSCQDAVDFLAGFEVPQTSLIYLDPPYYHAGRSLYLNAYKPADHAAVCECVRGLTSPWIVSYDDTPEIRLLYKGIKSRRLNLLHTARTLRTGKEVLFFSPGLRIPRVTVRKDRKISNLHS